MGQDNGNPPASTKLCPFLGMVLIPSAAPGPIIRGGQPELQLQIQMQGCVEGKCMFYDTPKKCCTIERGMAALVDLKGVVDEHKGKLSLLSMFTKKG